MTDAFGLVAAGGNSRAARSARVRLQWRDRKGRWIEMGRGARFEVRRADGSIVSANGKFIGVAENDQVGQVYVRNDPSGLPDGFYQVNSSNAEATQATLDADYLEKQGIDVDAVGDRTDADIQNEADIVRTDFPLGFKQAADKSEIISDDGEIAVGLSPNPEALDGQNFIVMPIKGGSRTDYIDANSWADVMVKVEAIDEGRTPADSERTPGGNSETPTADDAEFNRIAAREAVAEFDEDGSIVGLIDSGASADEVREALAASPAWKAADDKFSADVYIDSPTPEQTAAIEAHRQRRVAISNLDKTQKADIDTDTANVADEGFLVSTGTDKREVSAAQNTPDTLTEYVESHKSALSEGGRRLVLTVDDEGNATYDIADHVADKAEADALASDRNQSVYDMSTDTATTPEGAPNEQNAGDPSAVEPQRVDDGANQPVGDTVSPETPAGGDGNTPAPGGEPAGGEELDPLGQPIPGDGDALRARLAQLERQVDRISPSHPQFEKVYDARDEIARRVEELDNPSAPAEVTPEPSVAPTPVPEEAPESLPEAPTAPETPVEAPEAPAPVEEITDAPETPEAPPVEVDETPTEVPTDPEGTNTPTGLVETGDEKNILDVKPGDFIPQGQVKRVNELDKGMYGKVNVVVTDDAGDERAFTFSRASKIETADRPFAPRAADDSGNASDAQRADLEALVAEGVLPEFAQGRAEKMLSNPLTTDKEARSILDIAPFHRAAAAKRAQTEPDPIESVPAESVSTPEDVNAILDSLWPDGLSDDEQREMESVTDDETGTPQDRPEERDLLDTQEALDRFIEDNWIDEDRARREEQYDEENRAEWAFEEADEAATREARDAADTAEEIRAEESESAVEVVPEPIDTANDGFVPRFVVPDDVPAQDFDGVYDHSLFPAPFNAPESWTSDPRELSRNNDRQTLEDTLRAGALDPRDSRLPFDGQDANVDPRSVYEAVAEAGGDPRRIVAETYDERLGATTNVDALNQYYRDNPEFVSGLPERPREEAVVPTTPLINNSSYNTAYALDPEPYDPVGTGVEGTSDDPAEIAQQFNLVDLEGSFRSMVESGDDSVQLVFGQDEADPTASVPVEAVRDAIQMRGKDTNQIILDVLGGSPVSGQIPPLPQRPNPARTSDITDPDLIMDDIENTYEGATRQANGDLTLYSREFTDANANRFRYSLNVARTENEFFYTYVREENLVTGEVRSMRTGPMVQSARALSNRIDTGLKNVGYSPDPKGWFRDGRNRGRMKVDAINPATNEHEHLRDSPVRREVIDSIRNSTDISTLNDNMIQVIVQSISESGNTPAVLRELGMSTGLTQPQLRSVVDSINARAVADDRDRNFVTWVSSDGKTPVFDGDYVEHTNEDTGETRRGRVVRRIIDHDTKGYDYSDYVYVVIDGDTTQRMLTSRNLSIIRTQGGTDGSERVGPDAIALPAPTLTGRAQAREARKKAVKPSETPIKRSGSGYTVSTPSGSRTVNISGASTVSENDMMSKRAEDIVAGDVMFVLGEDGNMKLAEVVNVKKNSRKAEFTVVSIKDGDTAEVRILEATPKQKFDTAPATAPVDADADVYASQSDIDRLVDASSMVTGDLPQDLRVRKAFLMQNWYDGDGRPSVDEVQGLTDEIMALESSVDRESTARGSQDTARIAEAIAETTDPNMVFVADEAKIRLLKSNIEPEPDEPTEPAEILESEIELEDLEIGVPEDNDDEEDDAIVLISPPSDKMRERFERLGIEWRLASDG